MAAEWAYGRRPAARRADPTERAPATRARRHAARRRRAGRRLPRRRDRSRPPARRAGLRRRPGRRGRRAGVRPGARRRARRAAQAPRRLRHRRRRVRRRGTRGRRHRSPRGLLGTGRAADRRAVDDRGRSLSPRLHHQRDGRPRWRARTRAAWSTRSEGRRDLEAKTIRVLHDRSFVDDPTRIFRALRYANRYGFELDEHTAALAREAIEAGLVGRLSPARLRDELVLLLTSRAPTRRLSCSRPSAPTGRSTLAWRPMRPRGNCSGACSTCATVTASGFPRGASGSPLLLATCREPRAWLDGLKLRRQDARAIEAAVTAGPRLVRRAARAAGSGRGGRARRAASARRTAVRARTRRPACAARIFRAAPERASGGRAAPISPRSGLAESPRVGEVLSELRRRKLNGELTAATPSSLRRRS